MTKEALKDLLDAVEAAIQAGDWKVDGACDPDSAIRQAKEALAQTQEPMATLFGSLPVYDTTPPQRKPLMQDFEAPLTLNGVAVYPRQKPLSYEQIEAIWDEPETTPDYGFVRAIEAAHGIKENT